MIFEPFHPKHGLERLVARRYRFVDPEANDAQLKSAFADLFSGIDRCEWCDQFNSALTFTYKRRLLKEVRINLLLPWLAANFPAFKYILLLRHPAAVVLSQLRGGWKLSARRLLTQLPQEEAAVLQRLDNMGWPDEGFESNMIFWAVENRIALRAAMEAGALVIFYEDLCVDPAAELNRVQQYLDCKIPDAALSTIDKPSWSSQSSVADLSLEQKVAGWQQRISARQQSMMLEILEICEMADTYGIDPFPLKSRVDGSVDRLS